MMAGEIAAVGEALTSFVATIVGSLTRMRPAMDTMMAAEGKAPAAFVAAEGFSHMRSTTDS